MTFQKASFFGLLLPHLAAFCSAADAHVKISEIQARRSHFSSRNQLHFGIGVVVVASLSIVPCKD
jgi:hypothetical protein